MTKTIIWDFDGTLGYRKAGMLGASILEAVRRQDPSTTLTMEQLRPHLQTGFPWQYPEIPHTEITTADAWWNWIQQILERKLLAAGLDTAQATAMAQEVRPVYTNPKRWRLFDDTLPTLDRLAVEGWQQVILSNHVPELPQIVEHLGLNQYIDRVFNSADLGYEKPHPQAFRIVLDSLPHSKETWMIGDNMKADVEGAQAAGIPAILVRKYSTQARYFCETLAQVPAVIHKQKRS